MLTKKQKLKKSYESSVPNNILQSNRITKIKPRTNTRKMQRKIFCFDSYVYRHTMYHGQKKGLEKCKNQ